MTRSTAIALGIVLAATLAAFAPGLDAGFVWDDHRLIEHNANLRDAANLPRLLAAPFWSVSDRGAEEPVGYWRPWVTAAYFSEFQFFGLAPIGYHVVNLLLHLGCVVLVFAWLVERVDPPGDASRSPAQSTILAAALGSALFALHPTRPECVTWIAGCPDLWMTLFALATLLAATRGWAAAASALAMLSFLCKESAVVLPLVLAADAWLLTTTAQERRTRLRVVASVSGAIAMALLLRAAFVAFPHYTGIAQGMAGRVVASLGHYVAATLWPWQPTFLRGTLARDEHGGAVLEGNALMLGCVLLVVVAALSARARRELRVRPWLADAAIFVLPLVPVANALPLGLEYALVGERYLYLPLLGVAALVARAVVTFAPVAGVRRPGVIAVGAAIALALALTSHARAREFRDDATLWQHELTRRPDDPYALEMLAREAQDAGRHDQALALAQRGYAVAQRTHRIDRQIRFALVTALVLMEKTPDLDVATLDMLRRFYDDLAGSRRARIATARAHFVVALAQAARSAVARDARHYVVPRAIAHARTGHLDRAREILRGALAANPNLADAWVHLALVEARRAAWPEAIAAAIAARQRAPGRTEVERLPHVVERAYLIAAQPVRDAREAALAQAHAWLVLSAPGLARPTIDALLAAAPDDADLVQMRARIDAADRRIDLARSRIHAAMRAHPEHTPRWQAALAELEALQAHASLRATPGTP